MIDRVFIDMDGVLADFVGHILTPDEFDTVTGKHDLAKTLGISQQELWQRTESDPSWWYNIPLYAHTKALIPTILDSLADDFEGPLVRLFIATTPKEGDHRCIAQKADWLGTHISPLVVHEMIPLRNKWLLATPSSLLIDDDPRNIREFRTAGGQAILFPSHCNELWHYAKNPLPYLTNQIDQLI